MVTIECDRHGQPQRVAVLRWRDEGEAGREDERERRHLAVLARLGRATPASTRPRRPGVVATFTEYQRRPGRREFRGGSSGSRWVTTGTGGCEAVLTCSRGCRPVRLPLQAAEALSRHGGVVTLDQLRTETRRLVAA